jgi:hypothetical protein
MNYTNYNVGLLQAILTSLSADKFGPRRSNTLGFDLSVLSPDVFSKVILRFDELISDWLTG